MTKEEALRNLLKKQTHPLLKTRFEAGLSELVSERLTTVGIAEDDSEIYATQVRPGVGALRAVLPRSEYPELYRLHDEASRIHGKRLGSKGG